jgi:2-C-methyl-D-erythritol 2,4-cyclodiphosphate synthase
MSAGVRVGNGFDVHALVAGRRLVIGGVSIPFERGLAGHSDADVLLHAICDAILGALGAGDLGGHFPDSDPAYKDADSRVLLRKVWQRVREAGYALGNIDATVIAEAPRIAPYVSRMVANIAEDCGADSDQVNVKATTTETLGFTGRREGIAAMASVLLVKA